MVSDSELVRRIQGGAAGFELLVDRFADDLYGLAYSLLRSDADAHDLVQETFLAAMGSLGKFEGRSSIKTWLVRILVKQAAKLHRSRKVRRATALDAPEGQAAEEDPAMHHRSPVAAIEAREDLASMLSTLSEEFRQVVILRELERMTYDEIAKTLGVPLGTVESRLYRARQELQRRFKGYLEPQG